jgi:hypothetical protein
MAADAKKMSKYANSITVERVINEINNLFNEVL